MNLARIVSLSLPMALSLTLLVGCGSQTQTVIPADTSGAVVTETPEVTPEDTPETTPEEIPQEETPDLPLEEETPVLNGDIVLSRTDFTLFSAGEQYQLTLSNLLSSDSVTFSSSDVAVATVDDEGTVTAVGNGSATITATILLDGITAVDRTAIVRCDIEVEAEEEPPQEEVPPPIPEPTVLFDVATFYDELAEASDYQAGMMLGEGEMLTYQYPTIADYDFLQVAVYMPMMSAVASELAFIEVADSADIDSAKTVLQARIDAQVAGGAWYPATIEGWEKNSRIVANGNFVMLAVAENVDDVVAAFNARF